MLAGFVNELEKLGEPVDFEKDFRDALRDAKKETRRQDSDDSVLKSLRGKGRPVSRDYLAATVLGAAATPMVFLAGSAITRALHNRGILKALKTTSSPKIRARLRKQIRIGPAIGSGIPKPAPGMEPLMTTHDAVGHAARGALYGSVMQMLKDRFSGSAGINDRRS